MLHNSNVVGDLRHHPEVMGHEDHAHAFLALDVTDQREDLRLGGDIKRSGRLVGNQDVGLKRQGHGDHRSLALTAGQLVRVGCDDLGRVRKLDGRQHLEHAFAARLFITCLVDLQNLVNLSTDAQHRIERRHGFLEDHADAVAAQCTQALRRCPQQIFAFKEYPTCAGLDLAGRKEPQYRPGHHGLARAGLPDHTQDLVARQAELQILHGMAAVSRRRQTNAQTVDL